MRKATIFFLLSFLAISGCSINPVTGDREFVIMSTAQEIELGKQNYAPMLQSQGGGYDAPTPQGGYSQPPPSSAQRSNSISTVA